MGSPLPVIAIVDVGKTNKKLFLFDEHYKIVHEQSARFAETVDEDGDPCENIESLRLSLFDSLRDVFRRQEFSVKAINFSTYGASFVYIGKEGVPVAPLYNYLKGYPPELKEKFYADYGGEEEFSYKTASPVLGSLNSGMQLYRIKHQKPALFNQIKWALHLPQYLSCLISDKVCSDITSIGCHTNLWDFTKKDYHQWVYSEGVYHKLAPIVSYDHTDPAAFPGWNYKVGIGLHDSSAALIPYLLNFQEPFVLISTGTWCISLNPFNDTPLTKEELQQDCLCYMHYAGKPVKASRLFAGNEHEEGVKKIAARFNLDAGFYKAVEFDPVIIVQLKEDSSLVKEESSRSEAASLSTLHDLSLFRSPEVAYHRLLLDIIIQQYASTQLVVKGTAVKRIFVDGGFSKNAIYMNLLASVFPQMKVYAASMAQATAVGAALAIHAAWNDKPLPTDVIELKYYSRNYNITM